MAEQTEPKQSTNGGQCLILGFESHTHSEVVWKGAHKNDLLDPKQTAQLELSYFTKTILVDEKVHIVLWSPPPSDYIYSTYSRVCGFFSPDLS